MAVGFKKRLTSYRHVYRFLFYCFYSKKIPYMTLAVRRYYADDGDINNKGA
jgi:hypothetical protein